PDYDCSDVPARSESARYVRAAVRPAAPAAGLAVQLLPPEYRNGCGDCCPVAVKYPPPTPGPRSPPDAAPQGSTPVLRWTDCVPVPVRHRHDGLHRSGPASRLTAPAAVAAESDRRLAAG